MGAFGDKFRIAREKKGISLDDVSNVTKISSRMLQAIEAENFDQLPGGVFNKGFIRAYAKHLGLNDEEAITDYLACLRQAQIAASESWQPQAVESRAAKIEKPKAEKPSPTPPAYQKPRLQSHGQVQVEDELPDLHLPRAEDVRPPRRDYPFRHEFSWRLPAVGALIVVLAAILWVRHSRQRTEAASPGANHPSSSQPAPPASSPATAPPATHSSSSTPVTSVSSQTATPAATTANPAAENATAGQAETHDEPASDVTVRTFPAATAKTAPAAKPAANLKLVIRASETSWIAVTADGQSVSHETLIAPAEFSAHASREIVVRVGNAAGVTFLWNGEEIPAQGAEAEVKTFAFDSNGMRVLPNAPAQ
ncbi:MAG TPA: RodZ domain-containing protein [Verrucomicrobiae bacterium]|nr:RodZ domain-containing protein [Verrucomicrobiae bacterium]